MNDTTKKPTPVPKHSIKQSVVGEEDPGSAVDTPENSTDSAPPPAHPDKRVAERDIGVDQAKQNADEKTRSSKPAN